MRGGRLQPGSIMKWLAVGLAASPTKGWGRRRELGSLPRKVSSPERRSPSRARQRLRIRISRRYHDCRFFVARFSVNVQKKSGAGRTII